MASYTELFEYRASPEFHALANRIEVAVAIKAAAIAASATPTAEEKAWAVSALTNPRSAASAIINYVIADNNGLTIAQISAATDAQVQPKVDTAVDKLFGA